MKDIFLWIHQDWNLYAMKDMMIAVDTVALLVSTVPVGMEQNDQRFVSQEVSVV